MKKVSCVRLILLICGISLAVGENLKQNNGISMASNDSTTKKGLFFTIHFNFFNITCISSFLKGLILPLYFISSINHKYITRNLQFTQTQNIFRIYLKSEMQTLSCFKLEEGCSAAAGSDQCSRSDARKLSRKKRTVTLPNSSALVLQSRLFIPQLPVGFYLVWIRVRFFIRAMFTDATM